MLATLNTSADTSQISHYPWDGVKLRLWSLVDMIDCRITALMSAFEQLRGICDSLYQYPDLRAELSDEDKDRAGRWAFLHDLESLEAIIDDERIRLHVWRLRNNGRNPMSAEVLIREYESLKHDLVMVMANRKFAYIPTSVSGYFEQDRLFGDAVYEKFPMMRNDIKDAGNCIASGLPTAAVFHLIRVAEYGLRHIARRMKMTRILGKKNVDISETTWETLLRELRGKLESAHQEKNITAARAKRIALYSDAADHAKHMQGLWRNGVSHLAVYNEREALNAFDRVKGFIQLIAGGFA